MSVYVPPTSFHAIAKGTLFFVQASAALAVGGAAALARSLLPLPDGLATAAANLSLEAERAVFGEEAATMKPSRRKAALFVLAGAAGVPFFLAVGMGEAALLAYRRRHASPDVAPVDGSGAS